MIFKALRGLKRFDELGYQFMKVEGFFVRPCYAEKNRATAVAGRDINTCWRQLEAKSFGVYVESDLGQLQIVKDKTAVRRWVKPVRCVVISLLA